MLRYVRIEQGRRTLGSEQLDPANVVLPPGLALPTATVVVENKEESEMKRMLIEYNDAAESAKGIEKELDYMYEEKSSSLFSFTCGGGNNNEVVPAAAEKDHILKPTPTANGRLLWYSRFTAALHGIVAIIILCVNLNDESSHGLKTVTTKTLHTWVGANSSAVTPVKNLGISPRDSTVNIMIKSSDKCIIAGDVESRSRSFKVRDITVEVGELDIRWMMFAFFTFSCLFQLTGAFSASGYGRQLKWGKAHRSHLFEYSVSASLMMMALCAQVGVTDVYILTNVFTNTFACMIFGLLSDVLSDSNDSNEEELDILGCKHIVRYSLVAHLAGWVTLSVAVSVMIANIVTFQQCVTGISIPDEIFVVICMEAVLFCVFGLVQVYTLYSKPCAVRLPVTLSNMTWYKKIKDELNRPLMNGGYNSANIPNAHPNAISVDEQRLTQYISERAKYLEIYKTRINVACNAEFAYITLSLFAKMLLGGIVYISAVMRSN